MSSPVSSLPSAVTTVVWDFGAVLFRWRPQVLLAAALPKRVTDDASGAHWREAFFQSSVAPPGQGFAPPVPQGDRGNLGRPGVSSGGDWAEFDRGTVGIDDLAGRIARRTGLDHEEALAVIHAVPDELQPIADTVELVHALRRRGHRQFYLSNMPAPYADHLEREHAFVRGFEDGLFSARVQLVKPDAALFEMAEQRFGLEPARTVFVDDHPRNVEAARARGWHAVLATDAAAVQRGLAAHGLLG